MASTRFFISSSILLFLMLVIASAAEYGYSPTPTTVKPPTDAVYNPKPTLQNPKPDYEYGPNPKSVHVHLNSQFNAPKSVDGEYVPTPQSDTPKSPTHEYVPKTESKSPQKPESEKSSYQYTSKPEFTNEHDLKPNFFPIGIEGLVLCKSGSNYIPIKGATARITCSIMGHDGYEAAPYSCLTSATDEKGYFFKTLGDLGVDKMLMLTDCKVKLEKSPLQSCNIPTNVNRGITGAMLSSYQILHEKKIKLFPVGPFFYTSDHHTPAYPQSIPTPAAY